MTSGYDHGVNASPQVLVIGGGIAGLAAAYELTRTQTPFTLLEASSRVGGVILSERVDGFTIDGGPDALLIQKPAGIKLCEELGLGDQLIVTRPPRLAFIQRRGRLYALPAGSVLGIPTNWGPFIRTGLFSWPGKIRTPPRMRCCMTAGQSQRSGGALSEPVTRQPDASRMPASALMPLPPIPMRCARRPDAPSTLPRLGPLVTPSDAAV